MILTIFASGTEFDFWRVVRFVSDHRLLLVAEMKIPGRLWLQFDIEGDERRTEIRQHRGVRSGRIGRPGLLVPATTPCTTRSSRRCSTD